MEPDGWLTSEQLPFMKYWHICCINDCVKMDIHLAAVKILFAGDRKATIIVATYMEEKEDVA